RHPHPPDGPAPGQGQTLTGRLRESGRRRTPAAPDTADKVTETLGSPPLPGRGWWPPRPTRPATARRPRPGRARCAASPTSPASVRYWGTGRAGAGGGQIRCPGRAVASEVKRRLVAGGPEGGVDRWGSNE